ncbi:MAG: hypothetical protein H8E31_03800 [Planctomycetes bacterium]|nr:hypothetical protein [Planctomycetota bacterium]
MKKLEVSISAAALAVAIAAFWLSWSATAANQQYLRLSVTPKVQFRQGANDDTSFVGLQIENFGLGPALVRNVVIAVDGKVQGNWQEAISALDLKENGTSVQFLNVIGEQLAVPAGKSVELIGTRFKGDKASVDHAFEMEKALARLQVQLEYASMYREQWVTIHSPGGRIHIRSAGE